MFLESGALESLRRNRFAILPWSEHEVQGFGAEHGLLLLLGVEHVDELERQVVLRSQGPHRLAVSRERVWLRARMRRRQRGVLADDGDVDPQGWTAEWHHPRLGPRRGPDTAG